MIGQHFMHQRTFHVWPKKIALFIAFYEENSLIFTETFLQSQLTEKLIIKNFPFRQATQIFCVGKNDWTRECFPFYDFIIDKVKVGSLMQQNKPLKPSLRFEHSVQKISYLKNKSTSCWTQKLNKNYFNPLIGHSAIDVQPLWQ